MYRNSPYYFAYRRKLFAAMVKRFKVITGRKKCFSKFTFVLFCHKDDGQLVT